MTIEWKDASDGLRRVVIDVLVKEYKVLSRSGFDSEAWAVRAAIAELKRAAKKPKSEVVSVPWDGEGVARNTEEMVRADKKKPKRKP